MKILALEFSSPQRSVAVVESSERTPISLSEVIESNAVGGRAVGMIAEALSQAGLEREKIEVVVVGLGPGSYVGIRSAIALAQGWQLASGLGVPSRMQDGQSGRKVSTEQPRQSGGVKLLGLSSAECLAAQAHADGLRGRLQVVIDAQRNEFYLAGYDLGSSGWREIEPLRLATQAEVEAHRAGDEAVLGPEVARRFPGSRVMFPRAAILAQLALTRTDFVSSEKLAPIYLRETSFVKAPPPRHWQQGL